MYMFCFKNKLKIFNEKRPEKKAQYLYLNVFDLDYFYRKDSAINGYSAPLPLKRDLL